MLSLAPFKSGRLVVVVGVVVGVCVLYCVCSFDVMLFLLWCNFTIKYVQKNAISLSFLCSDMLVRYAEGYALPVMHSKQSLLVI